jgi:hypothetical protein
MPSIHQHAQKNRNGREENKFLGLIWPKVGSMRSKDGVPRIKQIES